MRHLGVKWDCSRREGEGTKKTRENYTSCVSLGVCVSVWVFFFLLNVPLISFSNDSGATAAVAAGCQKNLEKQAGSSSHAGGVCLLHRWKNAREIPKP